MGIDVFGNDLVELENLIPELGVFPIKEMNSVRMVQYSSISSASLSFAITQNEKLASVLEYRG